MEAWYHADTLGDRLRSFAARIQVDHAAAAGLLVLGYLVPQILRWQIGVPFPAGSDSALWAMSALNLTVGAPSLVPPVFPGLAALAHMLTGCHPLYALSWISALSVALIGPVGYALARTLGARPASAAVGAAVALLTPQLAVLGAKAQPDGLTALILMAGILVARWMLQNPGPRSLAAAVALAGLAPLLREHGLVISLGLAGVALVAPGHPAKRIGRVLLMGAAVFLGPLVLLHPPGLPWEHPWFERLAQAGEEMGSTKLPEHAGGLPDPLRASLTELYEDGKRARIVLFHARWAIQQAPWLWLWIALGFAALVKQRQRLSPLVGLVPVLPALVIWSAPRHAAVALPIATALWAAWMTRSRHRDMLLLGLGLGFLLGSQTTWKKPFHESRAQALSNADLHPLGVAICERTGPGDLAYGQSQAFLFCPMPRHRPQFDGRGADWKVWMASSTELYPPWYSTGISNDEFEIYRSAPWLTGEDRPCNHVRPVAGITYITTECNTVETEPPCWESMANYPEPQPGVEDGIEQRATASTTVSARQTHQVEVEGTAGPLVWGEEPFPRNPPSEGADSQGQNAGSGRNAPQGSTGTPSDASAPLPP